MDNKFIAYIATLPPSIVIVLAMWLFMLFMRFFDWIVFRDMLASRWGIYAWRAKQRNRFLAWFFYSFVHGNWKHFWANSWTFLLFGFIVAAPAVAEFVVATIVIIITVALGVWLFEVTEAPTVGASGLVTGYFGYIILRGFFLKDADAVIIALILGGVYFWIFRLVFVPQKGNTSNVGHFFGFLGGIAGAWIWSMYVNQFALT